MLPGIHGCQQWSGLGIRSGGLWKVEYGQNWWYLIVNCAKQKEGRWMQHVRISVKHLTTVPELAAKLTQSSSVINTGIWTKQPRNGTQPGCPPGAALATRPETFQNWASCERRKANPGLNEQQDGQSCRVARGGEGLESTQSRTSRPVGAAMPSRSGEHPQSLPALCWGVVAPSHRGAGARGTEQSSLTGPVLGRDAGLAGSGPSQFLPPAVPGTDPLLRERSSRHSLCRG